MNRTVKKLLILLTVLFVFNGVSIMAQTLDDSHIINTDEKITEAGTYFIRVSMDDDTYQYVRVHVRFPKTILDYEKKEGIDAHDIVLLPGTFEMLSEQELLAKSGVHSWDLVDGSGTLISNVAINDGVDGTKMVKELVFSTDQDLKISVSVFEQNEINVGLEEVYINQKAVNTHRLRFISLIMFALVVLPFIIYLLIFYRFQRLNKEAEKLLYSEEYEKGD